MSYQKNHELTTFSSSSDLQEEPAPQAPPASENTKKALQDTAYQQPAESKGITPASQKDQKLVPLTTFSVDPQVEPENSSSPQASSVASEGKEKKPQNMTYRRLLKPAEDIALTSYPSSPYTTNFRFLESFQKHCEAFEKLNLLNTGVQFTLQEKIMLEQIVDQTVGQIAKLLHQHNFFPEYVADTVYSVHDLLSIIRNLPQLEERQMCCARIEELMKLMQGQISAQNMLTSLIEDAKSLRQAINAFMEEPSEGKSLQTADQSKQIIQAYRSLLAQCRLNGFLSNDKFSYITLSDAKQRNSVEDDLLDDIIAQNESSPLKYKKKIFETGDQIGEALSQFNTFIKTITGPVSIDFWSHDLESTSPSTTELQYPLLQAVLKFHYLQQETVFTLFNREFPIKDCKLTLPTKDKSKTPQIEPSPNLEEKKLGGKIPEKTEEHQEVKDEKDQAKEPQFPEKEFNPKSSQQRILVVGSAGSGNTTLCQMFARQWVEELDEPEQQTSYAQQYNYVFLVSLPGLLTDGSNRGNLPMRVAAYIYKQFNSVQQSQTSLEEIGAVLSQGQNSRTLLILDGFDKVAKLLSDRNSPHYKILDELLGFRNVIVTTRNYEIPPAQYPFDSRRVSSKLSETDASAYIESYCEFFLKGKEKKGKDSSSDTQAATQQAFALKAELARNDYFRELTQTPLFLAIICENYLAPVASSSTPGKPIDKDHKVLKTDLPKLSLGQLHHNIVVQMLERHRQEYRPVSIPRYKQSPHEFYAPQLLTLGAIAWHMYTSQKSIIEGSILQEAIKPVKQTSPHYRLHEKNIEQLLAESLALGFLQYHSDDEIKPLLERNYFFITSGFEKYFAALHLLPILQSQWQKQAKVLFSWLERNKYQPQHKKLLDFCAGLSTQPGYDFALSRFWQALLSRPLDVMVGKLHLQLVVNCLMASRFDPRIPARDQLMAEIRQWVDSMLLKDNFENTAWLKDLLHEQPGLLRACGWQLSTNWVKAAKHADENIQLRAITALGRFGVNLASYPESLELLFSAAREEVRKNLSKLKIGSAVKEAVAGLTVNFSAYPDSFDKIRFVDGDLGYEDTCAGMCLCFALRASVVAGYRPAIKIVLEILKLEVLLKREFKDDGMMAALSVLGELREKRDTIPEAASLMLQIARSTKYSDKLRIAALSALGPSDYPKAFQGMLEFTNPVLRKPDTIVAAIQALIPSMATNQKVLEAVLENAKHTHSNVRGAVLSALGQLPDNLIYNEKFLAAILAILAPITQEMRVSRRLARNLDSHPQALELICKAAEEGSRCAINILCLIKPHNEVVNVLCRIAAEVGGVRTDVFSTLAKWLPKLADPKGALACLLRASQHKNPRDREAAIAAFGQLGPDLIQYTEVFKVVCEAAVKDEELEVQKAALTVLGELRLNFITYKPASNIMFEALKHKPSIQKVIVTALGKIGEYLAHPDARVVLEILKSRAKDPKNCTQMEALIALSAMKKDLVSHPDVLTLILSHSATQTLLDTHTLIEIYLELEKTKAKSFWSFSSSPNPCLPVLLTRVQQEPLAIALDSDSLTLVARGQRLRFFLGSNIESAYALTTAIQQMRKKCEQPYVTFHSCMDDERPHYPITASPVSTNASLLKTTGKFKPKTPAPYASTTSTVSESKLILK